MKSWLKATLGIILSFMCLFTCVGYASISDFLSVSGTVKTSIPSGLFITSIVEQSSSRVTNSTESYLPYTTTVDAAIKKSSTNSEGKVTYTITVLNNTKLTYSYRGIYYQTNLSGYNGNSYVSTATGRNRIGVVCSLADAPAEQKKVAPGETLTFTATYTVGAGMSSGTTWKTLVNFQFGINVDGEREALEVIEGKFLNILNTETTYEQLIDVLDNKYDGRQEWTSNYIGNVTGSSSEDSVAVNTLFAGQLQITVGKEQMDATVLIKHENLDGNRYTGDDYTAVNSSNGGVFNGYGCEMTLYLTIDPLNRAGAYVPVYVVVFTCDRDENGEKISDWYRIGSTYAGTANVVSYNGGNGTGSFVTDNWKADAEVYRIVDGYSFDINGERFGLASYSHSVSADTNIKTIVSTKDINAVNTLKVLLDDAKRLIDDKAYAGMGIDLVKEAYLKYSDLYTVDENGKHTVDPDATIAKLSPAISNIYKVVNDALVRIDALDQEQLAAQN
jgi:hypothetical protein